MAARFDEAVRLAEQAFTAEFAQLVGHLAERLAAGPGGERKVFRDSAVENLRAFFERFTSLNVRSSAELERLVGAARGCWRGSSPRRCGTARRCAGRWPRGWRGPGDARRDAGRPAPSPDPPAAGRPGGRDGGGESGHGGVIVMDIVIGGDGTARCVYGEAIDLAALGGSRSACASLVEPDDGRRVVGRPVAGRRPATGAVPPAERGAGGGSCLARTALARAAGRMSL